MLLLHPCGKGQLLCDDTRSLGTVRPLDPYPHERAKKNPGELWDGSQRKSTSSHLSGGPKGFAHPVQFVTVASTTAGLSGLASITLPQR